MKIVITGASGFLGQHLVRRLLSSGLNGTAITEIILADRSEGPAYDDRRVTEKVGDIADPRHVAELFAREPDVVFHLAAVVSGEAEVDFDLGLRVNIDASRLVLEACRKLKKTPRVIFTSSVAVFGPSSGDGLAAEPSVDPRSSYGMEKAVAELLLKDYSRRGFVDGIVLRLPTISVRPGRPNQAASSFASGIIREPLSGERAPCPVPLTTRLWLLSPEKAVAALAHAAGLPAARLAEHRVINLPGLSVSVGEMLDTLTQFAGPSVRGLVYAEPDPAVERIVGAWPATWDDTLARDLGFEGDASFTAIIEAHWSAHASKKHLPEDVGLSDN